MKELKRILSLVVVFAMLLSVSAFALDEPASTTTQDAIEAALNEASTALADAAQSAADAAETAADAAEAAVAAVAEALSPAEEDPAEHESAEEHAAVEKSEGDTNVDAVENYVEQIDEIINGEAKIDEETGEPATDAETGKIVREDDNGDPAKGKANDVIDLANTNEDAADAVIANEDSTAAQVEHAEAAKDAAVAAREAAEAAKAAAETARVVADTAATAGDAAQATAEVADHAAAAANAAADAAFEAKNAAEEARALLGSVDPGTAEMISEAADAADVAGDAAMEQSVRTYDASNAAAAAATEAASAAAQAAVSAASAAEAAVHSLEAAYYAAILSGEPAATLSQLRSAAADARTAAQAASEKASAAIEAAEAANSATATAEEKAEAAQRATDAANEAATEAISAAAAARVATGLKDKVAKIVETGMYYDALSDAISAAESGQTVMLLKDVEPEAALQIAKNITLDLNGCTIERAGAKYVFQVTDGTLTIEDNGDDGTISAARQTIYNKGGTVNINGGTIKASITNAVEGAKGTINISGGVIETPKQGVVMSGTCDVNISGGEIKVTGSYGVTAVGLGTSCTGTLNITGGSISAAREAVSTQVYAESDVIIDGSVQILATSGAAVVHGGVGKMTIGGNVQAETSATAPVVSKASDASFDFLYPVEKRTGGSITITGGTFTSPYEAVRKMDANATVSIIGGTFNQNPSMYLAQGARVTGTDPYVVVSDAVAFVNGTGYATFQDAVVHAFKDGTVDLVPGGEITASDWYTNTYTYTASDGTMSPATNQSGAGNGPDGLTINGHGATLNFPDRALGNRNNFNTNGNIIFHIAKDLTISDVTIKQRTEGNILEKGNGIYMSSGTLSNVTFDGGRFGVAVTNYEPDKTINIKDSTFKNLSRPISEEKQANVTIESCDLYGSVNVYDWTFTGNYVTGTVAFWKNTAAVTNNNFRDATLYIGATGAGVDLSANYWGGGAPTKVQLGNATATTYYTGWDEATHRGYNLVEISGSDAATYTVTFKNGSDVVSTWSSGSETELALPAPTKDGYTFEGWVDSNETLYASAEAITGAITLYAKFVPVEAQLDSHTVRFLDDGAELLSVSALNGLTVAGPAWEKYGYSLSWTYEDGSAYTVGDAITADTDLIAKWTPNDYTLTYMVDDATYQESRVTYGSDVTLLDEPTKTGYTFSGWYGEVETMPADNWTVDGWFTANEYEIVFDANGGNEVSDTLTVTYDGAYGELPAASRENYTFAGWFTEDGQYVSAESIVKVAADQTLTARWERIVVESDGESEPAIVSAADTAAPAAQPQQQETVSIEEEATPLAALPESLSEVLVAVTNEAGETVEVAVSELPVTFVDVAEDSFARDAIAYVEALGLMNGTGSNEDGEATFSPTASTTGDMLATILYRATSGEETSGENWAEAATAWAADNNLAEGMGIEELSQLEVVSREQMVTVMYRVAEARGFDVAATNDLLKFTDAGDLSDYARAAMEWAVSIGLIKGTDVDKLSPNAEVTREQIALILMRFNEMTKDVV